MNLALLILKKISLTLGIGRGSNTVTLLNSLKSLQNLSELSCFFMRTTGSEHGLSVSSIIPDRSFVVTRASRDLLMHMESDMVFSG